MFFLAPRSVSSVPLLHYRSTAPLSPTLKGMQTHIKRGPLILKISRLCSSYFLPSYLSVNAIRMLVGSLSWQRAHTHSQFLTPTAVPHSAHLANKGQTDNWGLQPLCHLQTSLLGFLTVTLMQVNKTTKMSQNMVLFYIFLDLHHTFCFGAMIKMKDFWSFFWGIVDFGLYTTLHIFLFVTFNIFNPYEYLLICHLFGSDLVTFRWLSLLD